MGPDNVPRIVLGFEGSAAGAPDPMAHPEAYRGVATKRVLGYLVDVMVIGAIAVAMMLAFGVVQIVTFRLVVLPVFAFYALIPLCYHVLLIGGPRHATLGMRLFGLEMVSLTTGRPDYVQAAVHTVFFYLSVGMTAWLVLLVALFNPMRRTFHDFVAGTVVVNRAALATGAPS